MNRLFLLLLVIGITACSSDGEERPEYLDSSSLQSLEIPPKLTQIENHKELEIPEPSAKALKLLEQRDDVEGSVAPVFKGLKLKSDSGIYWLEVDKSAEQLWPVLQDFLAHEGMKIYRNEPLLGFMETEWVKEYQATVDGNFLTNLFSAVSPDVLDKFRIRVERVSNKSLSKVFVSHRGMEIAMIDEGTRWQQRDPEPMLERELLYRMVLFSGLNNKQADEIFAEYQPYQARIRSLDEESSVYEIVGQSDFVWSRIMHALDRLGVEIKQHNKQKGIIDLVVGEIPKELAAERDELSESSWLMNLLTGNNSEPSNDDGQLNITIQLQAKGNVTNLKLSHTDGRNITSGLPVQFRNSLVKLLQ
ncbi:MAG: outer membrane protein assembly factor BamC [Gammaproteobacteria bacterium]|nr:outer membrane protein assembly factor BamC [Gammaproteobacteria bacterium]